MRDPTLYRGIERLVQAVIQALLDFGSMLIAALGFEKPESYADIGRILAEKSIISKEDGEKMQAMASLGTSLSTYMLR